MIWHLIQLRDIFNFLINYGLELQHVETYDRSSVRNDSHEFGCGRCEGTILVVSGENEDNYEDLSK